MSSLCQKEVLDTLFAFTQAPASVPRRLPVSSRFASLDTAALAWEGKLVPVKANNSRMFLLSSDLRLLLSQQPLQAASLPCACRAARNVADA